MKPLLGTGGGPTDQMDHLVIEIIKLIPSLLWASLGIVGLVLFYRPICDELLPKLSGFKTMGIEFSFVKDSIDAAIELARKDPNWKVEVPLKEKNIALNRAKQHLHVFTEAQILWVDDHPENNLNERKMFRQLKIEIDTAKSTDEALDILRHAEYDLVISDIARGEKATAGLDFLNEFRKQNKTTPLIYYVGVIDSKLGVPAQAFGITNRPDELLHLVLDALERKKI